MYLNFKITNFRNLARVDFSDLKKINLITGMNGCGKTAILEAIFLNTSVCNAGLVGNINSLRGENFTNYLDDRPFKTLFHDFGSGKEISISGQWLASEDQTTPANRDLTIRPIRADWKFTPLPEGHEKLAGVKLDFKGSKLNSSARLYWHEEAVRDQNAKAISPSQPQATYRLTQDPPPSRGVITSNFSQASPREALPFIYHQLVAASKERNLEKIVDFVKILDKRVKAVVPLNDENANHVYVDIGLPRLTPLTMMGNGFVNILQMACSIIQTRSKVLIIDEIESGLHYSSYSSLSSSLIRIAQVTDVQFFITTHSGEFITSFAQEVKRSEFESICALRISNLDFSNVVTRFDSQDIINALEIEMDLR